MYELSAIEIVFVPERLEIGTSEPVTPTDEPVSTTREKSEPEW